MVIKKLNSMFHKHSRWLFGIFAAIIIIAFMDFLTPGSGGCAFSGGESSQTVGTAFGKKVTFGDLQKLEHDFQIFEAVTGNHGQRELRGLFYYYCVLERAGQLGFSIADKEIADLIRMMPHFQKDGRFDLAAYQAFLKEQQIDQAELVSAFRNVLIAQQLPYVLSSNVRVTDQEVEAIYRSNYPRVAIRVLKLKADDFAAKIKADEAALKKFMAANRNSYVVPGKLNVLAVELLSGVFKAQAEKLISDKAAADFIADRNLKGVDVKTIRPILVEQKAAELAAARMNNFYREVNQAMDEKMDLKAKTAAFREVAAKNNLTVIELKELPFNAPAIDSIQSPELLKELCSMPVSDSSNPLTRPRKSANGVAVACLLSRTMPRPMSFEEAKTALLKDYLRAEGMILARNEAAKELAALKKLAPAARAAAFSKLGKLSTMTYSMISKPENPEHQKIIAAAANQLSIMKTGDYSEVIPCEDGVLLVEMVKRMPALMSELDKNRDRIRMDIENSKAQQMTMEFITYLDRNCRYEIEERNPEK